MQKSGDVTANHSRDSTRYSTQMDGSDFNQTYLTLYNYIEYVLGIIPKHNVYNFFKIISNMNYIYVY